MASVFGKLLQRFSWKRLDSRRLQHELDTHRLLLLTEHYARQCQGEAVDIPTITAEAEQLSFEEMQARVAQHLRHQITGISRAVHAACGGAELPSIADQPGEAGAGAAQPRPARGRGLWGMTARSAADSPAGAEGEPEQAAKAPAGRPAGADDSGRAQTGGQASCSGRASMADVAARSRERLGFSLHLAPSSVGHAEAGDGVWLAGRAKSGAVVGLYPGIVYTRAFYREMANYPTVDRGNDYLMSRFDGAILDAQPWGRGDRQGRGDPDSAAAAAAPGAATPAHAAVYRLLHGLETRHPLALAHFANHPPRGRQPNVMIAAHDFSSRLPGCAELRRYIPNAMFGFATEVVDGITTVPDANPVLGLAFVAMRDIEDEEVLLNYRLSPGPNQPGWYHAVDAAEDQRRWG